MLRRTVDFGGRCRALSCLVRNRLKWSCRPITSLHIIGYMYNMIIRPRICIETSATRAMQSGRRAEESVVPTGTSNEVRGTRERRNRNTHRDRPSLFTSLHPQTRYPWLCAADFTLGRLRGRHHTSQTRCASRPRQEEEHMRNWTSRRPCVGAARLLRAPILVQILLLSDCKEQGRKVGADVLAWLLAHRCPRRLLWTSASCCLYPTT